VLDVAGPPERTGKARGTDLLDGTVTLPLILAREREDSLRTVDLRALDEAGAAALCDRIAATGVLDEVRSGARRRVDLAKRALERSALDEQQRQLLELVADGVVERYS
jgi:geranylgeranyl pyrophosphate synthase